MVPGKTIISEEVFAQLVKVAIAKVAHAELSEDGGTSFRSLAKGHAAFEIRVDIEYGSAIPDVLEDLRQAVVKEVAFMTDYLVDYVDVIVVKLADKKEEAAPVTVEENS